jgi:hypothetical protein
VLRLPGMWDHLRVFLKEVPPRVARLPSCFAYHKFSARLVRRCKGAAYPRISVNPAWTSVLGQANYAGVDEVSVNQGAVCVLRALFRRGRQKGSPGSS